MSDLPMYLRHTSLSACLDNLFNKIYDGFLGELGSFVMGYTQTTRVNEPGRTAWLKATIALD